MPRGGQWKDQLAAGLLARDQGAPERAGQALAAEVADPEVLVACCREARGQPPAGTDPADWEAAIDQALAAALEALLRPLEALARLDPLTGVGNRRALEEALPAIAAEAQRTGRCWGVLLVDLDGLKALNDRAGHPAGDRALVRLARALQEACRGGDGVFRLGGDEFVVLLARAQAPAPAALVARVRARGAPAFSWGAALSAPGRGVEAPWEVLERADQDLYRRRAARAQPARAQAVGAQAVGAQAVGSQPRGAGRRVGAAAVPAAASSLLGELVPALLVRDGQRAGSTQPRRPSQSARRAVVRSAAVLVILVGAGLAVALGRLAGPGPPSRGHSLRLHATLGPPGALPLGPPSRAGPAGAPIPAGQSGASLGRSAGVGPSPPVPAAPTSSPAGPPASGLLAVATSPSSGRSPAGASPPPPGAAGPAAPGAGSRSSQTGETSQSPGPAGGPVGQLVRSLVQVVAAVPVLGPVVAPLVGGVLGVSAAGSPAKGDSTPGTPVLGGLLRLGP